MPSVSVGPLQTTLVEADTAASVSVAYVSGEPVRLYPSGRVLRPAAAPLVETLRPGEACIGVAANGSGTAVVAVTASGAGDVGLPGRGVISADDLAADALPEAATPGTNAWLALHAGLPDALIVGEITRDANGAVISAPVVWPDGTTGTFTGTPSASVAGALDEYAITWGDVTVTQEITHNADGSAKTRPPADITRP